MNAQPRCCEADCERTNRGRSEPFTCAARARIRVARTVTHDVPRDPFSNPHDAVAARSGTMMRVVDRMLWSVAVAQTA